MVHFLLKLHTRRYDDHVRWYIGKPVLYAWLTGALYGTLNAALLFWQKLSAKLQEWGFALNPYNPCVENKMIKGRQCSVVGNVDDLKLSHVLPIVVNHMIRLIEKEFGQHAPLTITRSKVQDYLSMVLD